MGDADGATLLLRAGEAAGGRVEALLRARAPRLVVEDDPERALERCAREPVEGPANAESRPR